MEREHTGNTTREVINMEHKKSNFKLFLKNNGFYLVLVVCLLAVGTAIALITLPKAEVPEQAAEQTVPEQEIVIVGQSNDQTLQDLLERTKPTHTPQPLPTALPSQVPSALPTEEPKEVPKTQGSAAASKVAPPVTGTVVFGYATDKLIYSVTLDQWTTHDGVDIVAAAGTEVRCVFSGTVSKVEKNDTLGYCVRVTHSNGRETLYGNLGADLRVAEGDRVNQGDILGTVGTSAISECALDPHVHFALYVDGKPKNPEAYVRLG